MLQSVIVLISILAAVQAGCDNGCSGHGTCGERGICECYDNWGLGLSHLSGDCSERICPYDIAWVDTPDKIGSHHKYAECSNRGICNRDSGECECFPGYEGGACQRTACPNDCSGHGRCTYIKDMTYHAVRGDYDIDTSATVDFTQELSKSFTYYQWDGAKTRGCVCDPEYGDLDCSKRMCQFGTDVMDQRDDMSAAAKYQVQSITFRPDWYTNIDAGQTFALTFKSKLNETFTTTPIVYYKDASDFHNFILNIQRALEALPNRVIDKVEVHGTNVGLLQTTVNITFTGNNVQGPQHPITVRSIVCGDGCTPKLTGLELQPSTDGLSEIQASDFNSYECGRRGKCDYTTGLCQCFAGYTGLSCNVITSLV